MDCQLKLRKAGTLLSLRACLHLIPVASFFVTELLVPAIQYIAIGPLDISKE